MRNGHQNNKRMRGRNRKGQNPLTRVYESNGPDVKVRGTAHHVAEKYLQLARDASSSGDPVGAESYYQHAEHYFRVIAAVNEQFRQQQPNFGEQREGGYEDGDDEAGENEPYAPREPYSQPQELRSDFQPREQRDHGGDNRDHRDNNRGHRDNRGDHRRHRDHRDNRDNNRDRFQSRDRNQQPYRGNEEQPRVQPQDDAALDQLPAFVTGGIQTNAAAPEPDVSGEANGANGHEGGADRFPLHRRRRRRHGPRENAGGDVESAPQE